MPAQAISVRCQNCGSPLSLAEDLRFVTCTHCGSELEIVHDQSTSHSRLLKKIEAKVDESASRLRVVELELALERLDREWESQRESLCDKDKQGNLTEPSAITATATGIVLGLIGTALVAFSVSGPATSWIGVLAGLLFWGFATLTYFAESQRARHFEAVHLHFSVQRRELGEALWQAKQDAQLHV